MYATQPQSDSRTVSYVGLSAFLHFTAFALVILMKITQPEIKPAVVEIEILPPQGKQMITPLIHNYRVPEPQLRQPVIKTETPRIKRSHVARMKLPAKQPRAAARSARVRPLEQAPELETPQSVVAETLSEDALNEDFEKVDRESAKKISMAAAAIAQAHKQALRAEEDSLSEVKLQAQQEGARLAAQSKARRAKELAAAQKTADTQAAAEAKAAMAQAAAEKAERAAAKSAALFAAQAAAAEAKALASAQAAAAAREKAEQGEKNGTSEAESMANKEGQAGSPTAAKYGLAGGVRALEDLKQRPGNQRPRYDYDDRLNGRQGEIIFVAYISKQGSPVQFKMMKSSGHRELDMKTLKALKAWRFYPGQEGWVEIPFKWDLKGGPQEMPATLRRKISRN